MEAVGKTPGYLRGFWTQEQDLEVLFPKRCKSPYKKGKGNRILSCASWIRNYRKRKTTTSDDRNSPEENRRPCRQKDCSSRLALKMRRMNIRESRAIPVIAELLRLGQRFQLMTDAIGNMKRIFPTIEYSEKAEMRLRSWCCLVMTEWDEFSISSLNSKAWRKR